MTPKLPRIGQIVHFVLAKGARPGMHRPAIIVSCMAETMTVNLQVFCDGNGNKGDCLGNMFYWHTVSYDPAAVTQGTWHYPESETQSENVHKHD